MSIQWDIEAFETLPSTQDVCKNRADDGAAEGLVINARSQSAGRGRHGRIWQHEAGNLAFSFILRPEADTHTIGHFSILVGVALAKTIGEGAVLKWPNDVLVDGKKCAGILIDSDLSGTNINWLVVGVGVNTAHAPDIGAALNMDADAFLAALLENIDALYASYKADGFELIRAEWLARTYPKGTALNVGVFEDLDVHGNLVVRDAQNTLKTISAGDVYLKDMNYASGH